jgi:hypothetical protein
MRMLDPELKTEVRVLQLYRTPLEARQFRAELDDLLRDPEASEHFHILSDGGRDLSCSIVTPAKLDSKGYTTLERTILTRR